MKGVESPLLSGVQNPTLAAIQQGTESTGPVDGGFGVQCQLAVFPYTRFDSMAKVVDARPIRLPISGSTERLSVTVEPR